MVKVKIFGVLRSTTGLADLDSKAKTVEDIFKEISHTMNEKYILDIEKQKNEASDTPKKKRNEALEPKKELKFKDAIVYVDGERCMKKKTKLQENAEVWLLSPAAGG